MYPQQMNDAEILQLKVDKFLGQNNAKMLPFVHVERW